MSRFDFYRNPNLRATHELYLDVQSDLVSTSTRWCLPLFLATEGVLLLTRAQWAVVMDGQSWVVDTPNVLAVPKVLLSQPLGHLATDDQLRVETAIDFMLRGY
jgi:hypothetical protein